MKDNFKCPNCDTVYIVGDEEMFDLYEEGKATEFDCGNCGAEILIYSIAQSWIFETELNE